MKVASEFIKISLLFVLLITHIGLAETITVDPNGSANFTTIQEAVNVAYDHDTIVVKPGIYHENVDYFARRITITSTDPNDKTVVEGTVIDGGGLGNVVGYRNAEGNQASLIGLTIQGGDAGIYCQGDTTSPVITKCNIVSNKIGIHCVSDAKPIVTDCIIENNTNHGVYGCEGTIEHCTISKNGGSGLYACNANVGHSCIVGNSSSGIALSKGNFLNNQISGNLGHGISYDNDENVHLDVKNCSILGNSGSGIYFYHGTNNHLGGLKLTNSIVVQNAGYGIHSRGGFYMNIDFSNIWGNNTDEYFFGGYIDVMLGQNIVSKHPDFARMGFWDQDSVWHEGDHHLRSKVGRWDTRSKNWASDQEDSLCIDRGDPNDSYNNEPYPNGGRINMGAYGNTPEASKSEGPKPYCVKYPEMDFNGDCIVDQLDLEIFKEHWLECGLDPQSACVPVTEENQ